MLQPQSSIVMNRTVTTGKGGHLVRSVCERRKEKMGGPTATVWEYQHVRPSGCNAPNKLARNYYRYRKLTFPRDLQNRLRDVRMTTTDEQAAKATAERPVIFDNSNSPVEVASYGASRQPTLLASWVAHRKQFTTCSRGTRRLTNCSFSTNQPAPTPPQPASWRSALFGA
jgi:hypothetical protein